MVKELDLFDEFKSYLSEETVPEIDFAKNRQAIYEKLGNRSNTDGTRLRRKRIALIAAILACLAVYPVYAVTYSYFKELRGSGENISVKFQTATDELKDTIDTYYAAQAYFDENYQELIQERFDALGPGEAEKIIVRSPDGYETGFFAKSILKENYIDQLELFADGLKSVAGFESFEPVSELPGGFMFDKGLYSYQGDWYTSEEEMEALMTEAESNGQSYAVKSINFTDEVASIVLLYKNGSEEDTNLNIYVQHRSLDTYVLPEGSEAEEIDHNGVTIIAYDLPDENGELMRKNYNLVKNDLFFVFSFSEDIGNDRAIELIDALCQK